MQRVLVIGISGAGKSTFARALATRTGLPLIHLDGVFWRPGWVETPRVEWRQKIEWLASGERWIMDGTFDKSLDLRLPRADTVIWFDYPRTVALRRAIQRSIKTYGRVRADMGPGCPEKFDPDFWRYIWRFNQIQRPSIVRQLRALAPHLEPVIIRRDTDAAAFLHSAAEEQQRF